MSEEAVLHYFNGRGRAENVRMMLSVAGIKFQEKHYTTRKQFVDAINEGTLPLRQLPMLEYGGQKMGQSFSIARYFARKHGLYGNSDQENYEIDSLYDSSRDFLAGFMLFGFRPEEEMLKPLREKHLPKWLDIFDKIAEKRDSGYLVGDRLTMADVGLMEPLLATVDYFGLEGLDNYKHLKKYYETQRALPQFSRYVNEVRKPKNDETYANAVCTVLDRKV